MKIQHVNSYMKRQTPNQFCETINKLIDRDNGLDDQFSDIAKSLEAINKTLVHLQEEIDEIRPVPPTPTGDWTQTMYFNVANMGDVPGMCLMNTRLGFGISSGTFPTARADMESQIANGTLHSGTPPDNVAVPIYYNNVLTDGHVAVWDHGVVYSDKRLYPSIDSVTNGYAGWGELCDGVRVVESSN